MSHVQRGARGLAAAVVMAATLAIPMTASAHEIVESGSYQLEVGWLNEPVILGERNGLDLFVSSKDEPDNGIADISSLLFNVEYGSASHSYDIVPVEDNPGHYTAVFVPTREGTYTFHLTGTINGEAVDVSVEPEEVQAVGSLAFPGEDGAAAGQGFTNGAPSGRFGAGFAQTRTLEVVAIAGLILGLAGTGLGVYGLARKR